LETIGRSKFKSFIFGSFFIFQAASYLIFFRPIYQLWQRLCIVNLIVAMIGAVIAIHGGLNWDLIFPGMSQAVAVRP
jgi:hypothetical protein